MLANIQDYIQRALRRIKEDPIFGLLCLLFFLLPFERIPSYDIGGVTVRGSLIISAIIILLAIYKTIKDRAKTLNRTVWLLAAFLLWNIILIPFSLNPMRASTVTLFTVFTAMTAVSVLILYKSSYLKGILASLFTSTALVVGFGFYQYFGNILGLGEELTGLRGRYSWELFGFPRIQSTALEPLYFASFLLLPISIMTGLIIYRHSKNKRMSILYIFSAAALFLTVSRGGYAAFVFMVLSLCSIYAFKKWTNIKSVISLVALTAIAFTISFLLIGYVNKPGDLAKKGTTGSKSYTKQISDTGLEGGGDERAYNRKQAIGIIKTSPVVGVGPGNFGPVVQSNNPDKGWVIVNNETLELWAETGIIGLLLLGAFCVSLLVDILKYLRGTFSQSQLIAASLLCYLFAVAIQYQTFSTLYVIHIWVAIGLAMGIIYSNNRNNEKTL